jgi:ATP-binding cassette, subfamily B, bacterial
VSASTSATFSEAAPRKAHTIRRLAREARSEWRGLMWLVLLSLLATPLALLTPLPLAIAIDSGLGSQPLPGFVEGLIPNGMVGSDGAVIAAAAALVVIVALLTQAQRVGAGVLTAYTGERLLMKFRGRLFAHAQRLSLTYHDTRGSADTTYRVQQDANALQYMSVYGLAPLVTAVFLMLGMLFVAARIDWQLSLIALVITPALLVLIRIYRERLRTRWHEAKHLESESLAVVHETMTNLRVVKAFGQETREHDRYVERAQKNVSAHVGVALMQGGFELMIGTVFALGTAAVLVIGFTHVQQGTLTLGSLVLVLGYLTLLYDPLRTIAGSLVTLQSAHASAERVFAVLDETPDVVESIDARPLLRARGTVEFENVSFSYDARRQALEDVSFALPAGSSLGIAGPTGAGKTTLLNLLTRFYDPTSGRILLDGIDIRDFRLADLRAQFAIVLQEPVLFSTTIGENIAYGRRAASELDVVAAAKAAYVHEFVRRLPDGYDTIVGERGMTLSGGERQRISLARAFLKDAPILLLDEPTSAVDVASEAKIMDAMYALMRGRTTLMIAHRLSTLEACDAVVEIVDGGVESQSTWGRRASVAASTHA